ncbi:MAG: hypothetical protein ABI999_07345 [Acidobacteriota bacterium]
MKFWLLIFALVSLSFGCRVFFPPKDPTLQPANITTTDAPMLTLYSKRTEKDANGDLHIYGNVSNITPRPIATIRPVARLFNKDGLPVTSLGRVDILPLPGNSSSTFEIIIKNPPSEHPLVVVSFQDDAGEPIPSNDKTAL